LVVPGSQIPFTKGGDKDKATLYVIGEVLDELRRPVSSVRETVKLALDSSQQVQRKNVQYTTGFILTPGTYHFKFVGRDSEGCTIGCFTPDFTVRAIMTAPIKRRSGLLARQPQNNNKKGQNPPVRDGRALIPNTAHAFAPAQPLYLF